jgi:CheY-like chemotaxis protein
MAVNPANKRILVLSDNDGLSRVIKSNVNGPLEIVRLVSGSPVQRESKTEMGDFDLIVVAMSSPSHDPLIALSRASLIGQIRQVPILIISEKPLHPASGDRIVHLDFPFEVDQFRTLVQEILQGGSCVRSQVTSPAPFLARSKAETQIPLMAERGIGGKGESVDRQQEYWPD